MGSDRFEVVEYKRLNLKIATGESYFFNDMSCHGMSPVRPRSTHPPVGPFRFGRAGEQPALAIIFKWNQNIIRTKKDAMSIESFSFVVGGEAAKKD